MPRRGSSKPPAEPVVKPYGCDFIEIWEYVGERRGRCICKVKEEDEIACYKRAIEILISYSGKGDHAKYEQKAEQKAG